MKYEIPNEGGTYILNPKTRQTQASSTNKPAELPTEVKTDGTTDKEESNSN